VNRRQFIEKSLRLAAGPAFPVENRTIRGVGNARGEIEARYLREVLRTGPSSARYVRGNVWSCPAEEGLRRAGKQERRFHIPGVRPCRGRARRSYREKPFFHFPAGVDALSIATFGCNLTASSAELELSQGARKHRNAGMSRRTSFSRPFSGNANRSPTRTNEPWSFSEFRGGDTAAAAGAAACAASVVSNGYIRKPALADLAKHIERVQGGPQGLRPTGSTGTFTAAGFSRSSTLWSTSKAWAYGRRSFYLVIPTLNDDAAQIRDMVKWVCRELGCDVPLHFSRFHPQYRLKNLPPTPVESLERAWAAGKGRGAFATFTWAIFRGMRAKARACPNLRKRSRLKE